MKQRGYQSQTIIFSGGAWSQQQLWQEVAHLLPKSACGLVVDTKNEKQTQVMRQITRSFQDKGRQVLIWITPTKIAKLSA